MLRHRTSCDHAHARAVLCSDPAPHTLLLVPCTGRRATGAVGALCPGALCPLPSAGFAVAHWLCCRPAPKALCPAQHGTTAQRGGLMFCGTDCLHCVPQPTGHWGPSLAVGEGWAVPGGRGCQTPPPSRVGGEGGVGMTAAWMWLSEASRHCPFFALFPSFGGGCPSASRHLVPLISRSCLSFPPLHPLPFLRQVVPTEPRDCPCSTALCAARTEALPSRRTPHTGGGGTQRRLLGSGMSKSHREGGGRPLESFQRYAFRLTRPCRWGRSR